MKSFSTARWVLALVLATLSASRAVGETHDEVVVKGELGRRLEAHLKGLVERGFSGSVLVAKGGEVVLHQGYGLAAKDSAAACTPATVYDIGSITKQFTAAAILKLEMAGKLELSDSLSRFFKEVPADKEAITVHHLLSHGAGLRDALGDDYDTLTRDELIRQAMGSELLGAPGTKYRYSNLGYSLLAAIVEIVSDRSYELFLKEQLFAPAGMTQTGYVLPQWKQETLAKGYRGGASWGTPLEHPWAEDGPYWNLKGNGGILSTTGDMYRWHLALSGTQVLSKEAQSKMYTPHVATDEEGRSHYGYGWSLVKTSRDTTLIWHNGGNRYFFADFWRYPTEDIVVFLATNAADKLRRSPTTDLARIARESG